MSGSLQQRLDQIRDMQGRDPMPSGSQSPFGPGDPPPPLPPLTQFDPDVPRAWLDPDLDEPDPSVPPSPMIPPPSPLVPTQGSVAVGPGPDVSKILALVELLTWKGQPAPFSAEDVSAIRAITLRAFQRELSGEIEFTSIKRKRLAQGAAPVSGNGPLSPEPSPAPAPRKRGRPRGSLLK